MCERCTGLLNEAVNLTVRGRTLVGMQRRSDCLNASCEPQEGLDSDRFDDHVARHNCTCQPWNSIETRSLTPQLWAEDQFQRDLYDWEMRARKHIMEATNDQ